MAAFTDSSPGHVVNVGINGFGRMGRLAMRGLIDYKATAGVTLRITHINECCGGARTAAHLLEFDSVHGRWQGHTVAHDGADALVVDGTRVAFTAHKDPAAVDWRASGVALVLECTGEFRKVAQLERGYFAPSDAAGGGGGGGGGGNVVRRVVVSAPLKGPKDAAKHLDVVMGVNDALLTPAHEIATAASCTTNCLAPVVAAVHGGLGIVHGTMTTIHNVTNTQTLVDAATNMKKPGDLRRARSGLLNLAPTSTGSATAITQIIPELAGKLNGLAVRVPLTNASLVDCVFEVARATTREEVNAVLKAASDRIPGVLGFEERTLVSTDYVNDPRSGVVDAACTLVTDGTLVKIYAWYDNEWGYALRLVDVARRVAELMPV